MEQKKFQTNRILPMLRLVPRNEIVLMINLMRILVRLVQKLKVLETLSRFCANLSAIGCTQYFNPVILTCGTLWNMRIATSQLKRNNKCSSIENCVCVCVQFMNSTQPPPEPQAIITSQRKSSPGTHFRELNPTPYRYVVLSTTNSS